MEKCEIDGVVGGGDSVFVIFVCGFWVWTSCLGEVCWARMNECCSLKRWNEQLLTTTKMRNERGAGMHPCVIIMMMENDSKARESIVTGVLSQTDYQPPSSSLLPLPQQPPLPNLLHQIPKHALPQPRPPLKLSQILFQPLPILSRLGNHKPCLPPRN